MSESTGNPGSGGTDGPFNYDPYGTSNATLSGEPFRYVGMYLDFETGLYYDRARYYSTSLGRFLQTDPVGYKDDLDMYTYVGNDPADKTDPLGLAPGDPFNSAEGAGVDAALSIMDISISDNREFGGAVYKGADGHFYAQLPTEGHGDHIPWVYHGDRGTLYGDYHSHGDYSKLGPDGSVVKATKHTDIFGSDHFSSHDHDNAIAGEAREHTGYKEWLATPGHDVKQYDPLTGTETTVVSGSSGNNSTPQNASSSRLAVRTPGSGPSNGIPAACQVGASAGGQPVHC